MGPDISTATNGFVDYGLTVDELTTAVDRFATATYRPIQEIRLHSISGDRTIQLEDAITWDGGPITIDASELFCQYKEDGMEDFDVPAGADTALLDCLGVM